MSLPIVDDEPEKPTDEIFERRGVANPRIVDLITSDRSTGEVVLKIFEPRPWGAVEDQLQQLEDKYNVYLGYVLDGFLTQQYPQYRDRPVRIHLECVEEPGDGEMPFLVAASRFAESQGLRFTWQRVEDTSAWRAPWEASKAEKGEGK